MPYKKRYSARRRSNKSMFKRTRRGRRRNNGNRAMSSRLRRSAGRVGYRL